MPQHFYYSTAVMLISSFTMQWALKSFKERSMQQYRRLLTVTMVLGFIFIVLQITGFSQLWNMGVRFRQTAGAGQFLYVIFGLHAVHVLGGIIALIVMFLKAFSARIRNYNPVPVEVMSTYWHFVDLLWVYLFVFFLFKL
jgi:cytochrome c oxidase subunit 3